MINDTKKLIKDINKRIDIIGKTSKINAYEDWDMVPDDICWYLNDFIFKLQNIHDSIYKQARVYDEWEESIYD